MVKNLPQAAKNILHISRRLLRRVLLSLLGAFLVIIVFGVLELNSRPDLSVWHETVLDEEFTADSGLQTFDEYLELEDRLFKQLDQEVYQKIEETDQRAINRYFRGSHSDPDRWPTNWNRSFVMPVDKPAIGVLLIHGMSDSPYSLRSIGELLHDRGAYVIGMRVPGHGQAPSGLLHTTWEDMAAAVPLAVRELQDNSPGAPLYIVGYSNGGALAVNYTLDSLADENLKIVDGLILISPEIGISKLAVLAKWQERLGNVLGLEKLAWNSLLPEYDPWKYGSFALNAGDQAHLITREIQRQITRHTKEGNMDRFPPILAFQSVVDSTVTAPALVHNLFERLPAIPPKQGETNQAIHELVLFDINRYAEIDPLLKSNPSAWIDPMLESDNPNYLLTLLSNSDSEHTSALAFSRKSGSSMVSRCDTGLSWPEDVYSLSHVALPIPPEDPVYGGDEAGPSPGVSLGDLSLRGEKGVLQVPAADQLRLRYNPFHAYLRNRILGFMSLGLDADGFCLAIEPVEQKKLKQQSDFN